MIEYTIEVREGEHLEYRYIATFDNYDGAPDGNNSIGLGDTHAEAIMDLVENYNFKDEPTIEDPILDPYDEHGVKRSDFA